MSAEDPTDILLENKLLFEQLSELKAYERQYLNERNNVITLLSDQYSHLKDAPYYEIVTHLLTECYDKTSAYDKAISRAIEKEGEVITVKARLNSVQQHGKVERLKLEEELKQFKDKAKNDKDRQNLTANEQITLLVQERDTALFNEETLAERAGQLMDEIVKLNEEVAKVKQQKLDICLDKDSQNEELLQIGRELARVKEEDERLIRNLQEDLTRKFNRCEDLQQELLFHQKRTETQRQELQTAGDSVGSQQIELFQFKAKVKDLLDQIAVLNRQIGTLHQTNETLNNDNHLLAQKFVDLSESLNKKDESLKCVQRDYYYKLEEVEKVVQMEQEKHFTAEAQLSEKRQSVITLQNQINALQAQCNKAVRIKSDVVIDNEKLKEEIDRLQSDKKELIKEITNEDETLQRLLATQDQQNMRQGQELTDKIKTINGKLTEAEDMVDTKEGEINLLKHNVHDQDKTIKSLEERLENAQNNSLICKQKNIDSDKQIELLQQDISELKLQLNEVNVHLEFSEEQLAQAKEVLCSIEVFTGSEMKVLYPNIGLIDNLEKLKEVVLDNNQLLGTHRNKVDTMKGELRNLSENNQHFKEKLQATDNENSSLQTQLTSTACHLELSHKEIRQLRTAVLKGEKGKRIIERRVHAIEGALSDLQHFAQKSSIQMGFTDKNKEMAQEYTKADMKEMYEKLSNVVQDLVDNPNPGEETVEVELVMEELRVLREEIQGIQQQHAAVVGERDATNKKLFHEQNWVDKLRTKEEDLTRLVDEKNEQLSTLKHELQLKERLMSDKERAYQLKKGALEEEIKALKMRYKTMMAGEQCGHAHILEEADSLKRQLEVARNTVQYKEGELSKLATENKQMEQKLKTSNTEQLRDEILKLNIANSRLQGQLSGSTGANEETNYTDERNNLLTVIAQKKAEIEECSRKLFQTELRSETLVNAVEELKSQHELERNRYKRDLEDFHERVTTQKEQQKQNLRELDKYQKQYHETRKLKENAEEEVIRLSERVQQLRASTNTEQDKITRIEKELVTKQENLNVLGEKCSAAEDKGYEQEVQLAQLQRSNLALEQIKTTLQLKLADTLQKYEKERDRFENTKQKLKSKAKNYKEFYEKENSALVNKSTLLEEETALLKLHVTKEETWRRTTEKSYTEWLNKNRDLETTCATFEEEVRIQQSTIHGLNCTVSTREEEIKALNIELSNMSKTRYHYERMYRDTRSRANPRIASPANLNITHPILAGVVLSSTPIRPESAADVSQHSRLTLEDEGLVLDDPDREYLDVTDHGSGALSKPTAEEMRSPPADDVT